MSEPRIVVFDVETTGTDKQRDQIIELCVQFGLDEGAQRRIWRMRPEVAMHPGAQAVHGISAEDLVDCPPFADVADELRNLFADADMLVGYNLRFDIDMLQAEYLRLREPPLDLGGKLIVDPFRLWQQCEPRSLMDAHKRFVGHGFEAAHSASADVAATGRVLRGMIDAFSLPSDWEALADVCEPNRAMWMGGSKHIQRNEQDIVIIGFGRHAGIPLVDLARGPDASYLRWISEKDFPAHVAEIANKALECEADEFSEWARQKFPPPGAPARPAGTGLQESASNQKKIRSTGREEAGGRSGAQQSLFPN